MPKISELPEAAVELTPSDTLAIVHNGETIKATMDHLSMLILGHNLLKEIGRILVTSFIFEGESCYSNHSESVHIGQGQYEIEATSGVFNLENSYIDVNLDGVGCIASLGELGEKKTLTVDFGKTIFINCYRYFLEPGYSEVKLYKTKDYV